MAVMRLSAETSALVLLVALTDYAFPPSARASVMTRLTYYNQSVTWNTAHVACIQTGGILLQIRDDDKQAVVREAFQGLDTSPVQRLWLGQVRPSIEQPRFVHTDTCAPVTWAVWGEDEPRMSAEDLCLWTDVSEWRWGANNCSELAGLVCEHRIGDGCLYERIEDKTLEDPFGKITTVPKITAANFSLDCRLQCEESLNNGEEECWAVTFDETSMDNCALHFGSNQSYVHATSLRQEMPGKVLYLKKCYEVTQKDALGIAPVKTEWNHYDCAAGEFSLLPTEECDCPCEPLTAEESRLFMADILSSLTINTSNLSAVRRRYYSVVQNDLITLGLGYSGVIFIVIFFLVIILSDVDVLVRGRKAVFNQ